MKFRILSLALIGLLSACGESDSDEIYNENNTNVVDGVVYDINEKPINGIYKTYYPNGNVKMEVRSKSGKPEGEGRFYNEDGSLLFSGTFKNGLMNGKMLNFYPDGSIREENYYVDGIKDGIKRLVTGDDGGNGHAGGLDYVPYDGYQAVLHRGEKLLTASEAVAYDRNKGGNSAEIEQLSRKVDRLAQAQSVNNINIVANGTAAGVVRALKLDIQNENERSSVFHDKGE